MQSQLLRGEQLQQALAGPLEVPDETFTDLAVEDAGDQLVRTLVLLVAGDDLALPSVTVVGEHGEVACQVQHHLRSQQRRDGLLDLCEAGQPFGAVAPRGPLLDGAADRAVTERLPFGREAEHVADEHPGRVALVVVVDLRSAVHPADGWAHRRFRLADDHRDAVDVADEVEPLLRTAGERDLVRDHVPVAVGVLRVPFDEVDGDVLAVRSERHGALATEPRVELLVRAHQRLPGHADRDCTQPVDHFVRTVRVGRDGRVQPDERVTKVGLDEDVTGRTRKIRAADIGPANRCRESRYQVFDRRRFAKHLPVLPPEHQALAYSAR